ncbi:hypothetical protein [Acinetobacter portensis]|nr:hypothetical protein [Acinetobacter portensis]
MNLLPNGVNSMITGVNSAESLLTKIQVELEASKPVKKTGEERSLKI